MGNLKGGKMELSVIITVTERYDPVRDVFYYYKQGLEATEKNYEIIYVLDGSYPDVLSELEKIQESEQFTIITLAKMFGEATALNAAFSVATSDIILTLPAYLQTNARDIPVLVNAIDDYDMVMARRQPRKDSFFNRLQSRVFNSLLRSISDLEIHDAGCSVRIFRRQVVDEVPLYGDLHRFYPILVHQYGFHVTEIEVTQNESDAFRRVYAPGIYMRRLLDLLTVFFLVRYTKKPLRFFGLIGTALAGIGMIVTTILVSERLFFGVALANRPALILGSLLIVLGVQVIAIGLIGEIIIFTHAKELKEYKVDRIIN